MNEATTDTTYQVDRYHDRVDPVISLHEYFGETMPYMSSEDRLNLAVGLDRVTDPDSPKAAESDIEWPLDNPLVLWRFAESRYRDQQTVASTALLDAITTEYGQAETDSYARALQDMIADKEEYGLEPDMGLEDLYEVEVDGMFRRLFDRSAPERTATPTPLADYTPRTRRHFSTGNRPFKVAGLEIERYSDIHHLQIPEFSEVWEDTTEKVISALASGNHVLLGARRNSGKTHTFPGMLKAKAPTAWQITEVSDSYLNGSDGVMGLEPDSQHFFKSLKRGESVESTLEFLTSRYTHRFVRLADRVEPERKVLIVDESQMAALDPEMQAANVAEKLFAWADQTNTQLVLISALGDKRSKPIVKERLSAAAADDTSISRIDIEADFDRPQYPKAELTDFLSQAGVGPELANWWLNDPVATPLRTMRGVYAMFRTVLEPKSYGDTQAQQLRTTADLVQALTERTDMVGGRYSLIQAIAAFCAGSGPEMVALAEYLGIEPPDYKRIYNDETITPEDIE